MTDQDSNQLVNAMSCCAAALQAACIVQTGMIRVNVPSKSRRSWNGPPLRCDLTYAGVDLNDLPRHLYGGDHITPEQGLWMWDVAVEELLTTRETATVVQTLLPTLGMSNTFAASTAPLVQLLGALAWHGYWIKATNVDVYLFIGGKRIGLDQRTVTLRGQQMRLPRGCQISPTQVLRAPTGKVRRATATATAVYRHLVLTFPDLTPQLDVIFSAAVTGGLEFQRQLCDMFDLYEMDEVETPSVWSEARRTVRVADVSPQGQLWKLLKDRMTYQAFKDTFGAPSTPPRRYTALLRTRHSAALDKLESIDVSLAITGKIGNQAATAMKLMKLQQMMGSGA